MSTFKDPVPRHLNIQNLKDILKLLESKEYFLFFGTLLGLVRDGEIIEGDDDLDIFVEQSHRSALLDELTKQGYTYSLGPFPERKNFAQIELKKEGILTYIDFYFYSKKQDHIHWLTNHQGYWIANFHELKLDNSMIYPLQTFKYEGMEVYLPQQLETSCIYMYGPSWKVPITKDTQYKIHYIGYRPRLFRGFWGGIVSFVYLNFNRLLKLPWKLRQMAGF